MASSPSNPDPAKAGPSGVIAIVGDVHGHLQLALCMLARWQVRLGVRFEAVFLAGDVGTFTEYPQLDSATLSHAKNNPCELEFLQQWAVHPQAPWLARIFEPAAPDGDGLGLTCPVVMVHGNHEGFAHLETLFPRRRPAEPVPADQLRGVDSAEFIRYLPSGWKTVTPSGLIVAGLGGMERGQRRAAKYHPMAFIDDSAVEALLDGGKVDVLVTHQGPSLVQGQEGSPTLDVLLEEEVARAWFHGHGTPNPVPAHGGRNGMCLVVPLGDIAFPGRGRNANDPGLYGWSYLTFRNGAPVAVKETPPFWRDLRRHHWAQADDGRLVAPDLARFLWPTRGQA